VKVEVGARIPSWGLERVTPERMKTVAAILRDPNPIHWDRQFATERGLKGRLVNQSPINLGYIANMLMEWAGPACIRRLRVEFPAPVFDGDGVTAGGEVTAVFSEGRSRLARCAVWLDRSDGSRAVEGWAVVELPDCGPISSTADSHGVQASDQ